MGRAHATQVWPLRRATLAGQLSLLESGRAGPDRIELDWKGSSAVRGPRPKRAN